MAIRNRTLFALGFLSLTLSISGCGDSGNTVDNDTSPQATTLTGQFVDSAVAGLGYTLSSGLSGTTNEQGEFSYASGDTVSFSLGNLTLPETSAQALITPLDVFDTEFYDKNEVTNLVRLLMSLDNDRNAENGIDLPDLSNTIIGTIDFSSSADDFAQQTALINLMAEVSPANPQLADITTAEDHFISTLLSNGIATVSVSASDPTEPADNSEPPSVSWSAPDGSATSYWRGTHTEWLFFEDGRYVCTTYLGDGAEEGQYSFSKDDSNALLLVSSTRSQGDASRCPSALSAGGSVSLHFTDNTEFEAGDIGLAFRNENFHSEPTELGSYVGSYSLVSTDPDSPDGGDNINFTITAQGLFYILDSDIPVISALYFPQFSEVDSAQTFYNVLLWYGGANHELTVEVCDSLVKGIRYETVGSGHLYSWGDGCH